MYLAGAMNGWSGDYERQRRWLLELDQILEACHVWKFQIRERPGRLGSVGLHQKSALWKWSWVRPSLTVCFAQCADVCEVYPEAADITFAWMRHKLQFLPMACT